MDGTVLPSDSLRLALCFLIFPYLQVRAGSLLSGKAQAETQACNLWNRGVVFLQVEAVFLVPGQAYHGQLIMVF